MACNNDSCEYGQYCHIESVAFVEKENCPMYWKLEDYSWDAECLRETETDDYEDDEEPDDELED